MICVAPILTIVLAIFVMMTLLRWFEQTAQAVDQGWWFKLALLTGMPFTVWFFPGVVKAGRPTPVPPHEPVRGFGATPGGARPVAPATPPAPSRQIPTAALAPRADAPPPGTPKEFLGMPNIPPKKKPAPVDPDKLAKLRQKMKDQGMIEDEP